MLQYFTFVRDDIFLQMLKHLRIISRTGSPHSVAKFRLRNRKKFHVRAARRNFFNRDIRQFYRFL